jgi:hypothetical protein
MPTFKPKNIKNLVTEKPMASLDCKHEEFLQHFKKTENFTLPQLIEQRLELIEEYRLDSVSLDEKLDIKDKVKEIDSEIKMLKQNKKQYLLKNSVHIFNYFENKKNISGGSGNTRSLDKFFNIKDTSENLVNRPDSTIQKYLSNIDSSHLDISNFMHPADVCRSCNKGELIPIDHEGILVCNKCYCHVKFLIENDKPTYKEPPKEVCFYAYKRINHFREILAQFQAKETTLIPDEIIENIRQQIKKERLDIQTMTNKRTKEVLKKLKYNKYYEHIPFIKDKLGVKPPIMSPELEETLCNLFIDIQAPYARYCPEDRVNFLNYYYTIYKLCELLNQVQFLPYFPMLKDREKRIEQDEIWKNICAELDWKFISTI